MARTGWRTAVWLQSHRTLARWLSRVPPIRDYIARRVWSEALTDPRFVEGMERGLADLKTGRMVEWKEIRR